MLELVRVVEEISLEEIAGRAELSSETSFPALRLRSSLWKNLRRRVKMHC